MARIHNGILGKTTGKVASVVGSTWKGINYIRQRVVPKNPRTTLQQAQRANMRLAVWWSKKLIGSFTRPILDRFTRRMSGYNALIRWNMLNFSGVASGNEIQVTNQVQFPSGDNRFTLSRGSLPLPRGIDIGKGATSIVFDWADWEETGLLPTDFAMITISDLTGKFSPITRTIPITEGHYETDDDPTANIASFYRVVAGIVFIRFLHPETREVPIEISNSRTSVLAGNAPTPFIAPLLGDLKNEPENAPCELPKEVRREERVIGRKRRDTVLKEEVVEREEFDRHVDEDVDVIETETVTRAGHGAERGFGKRGRKVEREEFREEL